jgi:hypothetical protein
VHLEFFQRYEPTVPQILASRDPQLIAELADMHQECAQILKMAGQTALMDAQLQKAHQLLSMREPR